MPAFRYIVESEPAIVVSYGGQHDRKSTAAAIHAAVAAPELAASAGGGAARRVSPRTASATAKTPTSSAGSEKMRASARNKATSEVTTRPHHTRAKPSRVSSADASNTPGA